MRYPIREGCYIPDSTQYRKTDNGMWIFYNLDSTTPIPSAGERPHHCKDCTKCMPQVKRGETIRLTTTFEITPETVKK